VSRESGIAPAAVQLDVSAPHLKALLGTAFAKALSELPAEKVRQCWAPLAEAYTKMGELHAAAAQQLERLFPNKATPMPDGNEEEPSSDAEDDFEHDDAQGGGAREYQLLATQAVAAGVPAQRSYEAAVAAATAAIAAATAANDAVRAQLAVPAPV
jgi:hypothetical protein